MPSSPSSSASKSISWGATEAERDLELPCDGLLPDPDAVYWRAIAIDAAPGVVFRWLCQLRVAPYSYDLLDNFGRRSPPELTPGLEQLTNGQRFMTAFKLAEFETDRHVTLLAGPGRFADRVAVTYLVSPEGPGSRLLVKVLGRHRGGPIGAVARPLLPWGDLFMMRRQLLNLKGLAEGSPG